MVVYWWCVRDDLMVSWWSVGAVLVQTVQSLSLYCASASSWSFGMRVQCCVCEVFFWCCGGIWMVLSVVYGWSLACGCLGGGGIACCELSWYGWIFQLCLNLTRADTIHQSCTLVPHDISSAFPVLAGGVWGKGGLRRLWESKQVQISSKKIERQPKTISKFPRRSWFSCALSMPLNGWRFHANSSASSASRQAKVQFTSISLEWIEACSACSISSLSFVVLAAHVEAFWAMRWPLSWTWAFQCHWVLVHARRFWCYAGACCT